MNKWTAFFLIIAVFFISLWQNRYPAKGFNEKKIFSCALAAHYTEETPEDFVFTEELDKILSQEFYYIGSGSQTYAFHSADGAYVIKFFKNNHLIPKQWLSLCRYVPFLKNVYERKIIAREARCRQLTASCLHASKFLSQETAVIAAHVSASSSLKKKLTLSDRKGRKHRLVLDDYVFVVQKRAKPLEHYMRECVAAGATHKARMGIIALEQLIDQRCRKGFYDRDQGVVTNFGFIGDQIVQIDFGRLIYENNTLDSNFIIQEKKRVINILRVWYENNHPELRDVFFAVPDNEDSRQCDQDNTR